jgi:glutamine amidotransferase
MCRLYGFQANEPTKVECTLVHAQNALMRQSRSDLAGYRHAHGWGVAAYENDLPRLERQAWAAYHGEHFKRAAARVFARTVLAHVRRATVGEPGLENTHPFTDGHWSFIHNGTVPAFDQIKERMLEVTSSEHRSQIAGVTDSEHLFRLFLTRLEENPTKDRGEILTDMLETVVGWSEGAQLSEKLGLNIIVTNGHEIVATRWGRGLFHLRRQGVYDCEICGFPHVRHQANADYQAVVIASEPITHENWTEVPERSIVQVRSGFDLSVHSF